MIKLQQRDEMAKGCLHSPRQKLSDKNEPSALQRLSVLHEQTLRKQNPIK